MMDDLASVIETLKERISVYQRRPFGIRVQTYPPFQLIDPLLSALGWDTSDPEQVTLEFEISGKRVDYALKGRDGRPLIVVEAKRLGESLESHTVSGASVCSPNRAYNIRF